MRRIGLMGGTFDPIHIGHLILGESAYEQLNLDKVVFMPSGNPPHKRDRKGRASNEERLDMVKLACGPNPHFEVTEIEMNEEGYSYTFRTLEMLNKEHPDTRYYFIIGADSLFDFDDWMNPQRIADACTLVVATRNHTSTEALDERIAHVRDKFTADIVKLDTENIDVSSHMIRSWVEADRSIRYYVTDPVMEYIKSNNLYEDLPDT